LPRLTNLLAALVAGAFASLAAGTGGGALVVFLTVLGLATLGWLIGQLPAGQRVRRRRPARRSTAGAATASSENDDLSPAATPAPAAWIVLTRDHDAAHGAPQPPDDLRPAQLGLVLTARPVLGHVAATLVDLHERGVVELQHADEARWRLVRGDSEAVLSAAERHLLDALLAGDEPAELTALGRRLSRALHRFRIDVLDDAIAHGWLHRKTDEGLTPAGEAARDAARHYRAELRRALANQPTASAGSLSGYAALLGLLPAEAPVRRFARAFVAVAHDLRDWKPRPVARRDTSDLSINTDQWGGMSLDLAAAWMAGL
jgi:hypothetical protein